MRAWYGLNQSGTGWTKCGLTPEWGSSTPESLQWRSYIFAYILSDEIIVEGDSLTFFLF